MYQSFIANPYFAEFITGDAARQEQISAMVRLQMDELKPAYYGRDWETACYFKAAHELVMIARAAGGLGTGQITSISGSHGGASISFAQMGDNSESYYAQTPYGVKFRELQRRNYVGSVF